MLSQICDHDRGLKNIPRVFIRWSTDTLPSTGKYAQHPSGRQAGLICLLFNTFFIFRTRPWTTLRTCAPVSLASFSVNRSSLWTIASIFLSPASFSTNFSSFISQVINSLTDDGLTKFSLLHLFGRQRECGEQLHQNLDNYLVRGFCGRDLGIDLEAAEEVANRLEQIG